MSNSLKTITDTFEQGINEKIWSLKRINPNAWTISKKFSTNGGGSLKISLEEGWKKEVGNDGKDTERSEFSEQYDICLKHGKKVLYEFDFLFPVEFPIVNNRLVFAQWKQITKDSKSPFMSLRYIDKVLSFKILGDNIVNKTKKEIDLRGKWHAIRVEYRLSVDKTGHVKVFLDDGLFVGYSGDMGYSFKEDLIYFKFGLYRDKVNYRQTVYFDNFRRSILE